jgi:citrate lyase beta subunit
VHPHRRQRPAPQYRHAPLNGSVGLSGTARRHDRRLVTAFAPFGFSLSAPVFEHFGNTDLSARGVEHDIEHGLLTKTAIHPAQIEIIQNAYRVGAHELAEARAILSNDRGGVFALASMCEPRPTRAGPRRS